MDKRQVIKIEGTLFEAERVWRKGRMQVQAKAFGSTEKDKDYEVQITLDFDCISNIIGQFRKVWHTERENMLGRINHLNRLLP